MRRAVQLGIGLAIGLWCGSVQATSAPFFRGKTINLVIDDAVGSAPDTEGRVVAQYLSRYIPGKPTIVVRNMPGAGGLVAVNYVGRVAAPDGLTFDYSTGIAFSAALRDPSLKVDLTQMPLVAVLPLANVAYMRADYGGGVRQGADLMTKSGFWVGGVSPAQQKDIALRLAMDLLGLHYNYITGYPGGGDIRLAIQRNEVQVTQESMPAYRTGVEPLVKKGQITPLWYNEGALMKNSKVFADIVKGVPAISFDEFYKAHGAVDPNSELHRAQVLVNEIASDFGRMALMPPGSPPAAVAALRTAFAELSDDPDFRRDAMKTVKYIPIYAQGEQAERSFKDALKPDAKMVDFIHSYIAKGEESRKR